MRVLPAALLLLAPALALAQPAQPPAAVYPQPTYSTTNIFQPYAFGTYNDATGLSVSTGTDGRAQVLGLHTPQEASTLASRDQVALYVGNTAPPILATDPTPTYTQFTLGLSAPLPANTVTIIKQALAQCARNSRPVCMLIDTGHTPKYTGAITAIADNGTSLTVAGWYAQGNTAAGQVPSNTAAAFINPFTKIWAQNGILQLNANSYAQEMTYLEGDIYNFQAPYGGAGTIPATGVSMNCNANDCGYGFIGLSNWYAGYLSRGNVFAGYLIQTATGSGDVNPPYGFLSNVQAGLNHHPFAYRNGAGGGFRFTVADTGTTTIGDAAAQNGFAIQATNPGSAPVVQAVGVDTNIDVRLVPKGTGVVRTSATFTATGTIASNGHPFVYQPTDGGTVWDVGTSGTTNIGDPLARNGFSIQTTAAGGAPVIQALGPDTNIDVRLVTKGTGAVRNPGDYISTEPTTQTGGHPFMHQPSDAPGKTNWSVGLTGTTIMGDSSTLNGMALQTAAAGSPPIIQSVGVDANIDLRLVAKGTGAVRVTGQLNTSSGTLETPTTVAGLGTCTTALKGKRWAVTDATAQSFGATLVGGGSVTTAAFCNGTAWINL